MSYSLCGLALEANGPIPGLAAVRDPGRRDVRVWFERMPDSLDATARRRWYTSAFTTAEGLPLLTVWELDGGAAYELIYSDDTRFVVDRRGSEIWTTWPRAGSREETATYLLGPVLAFVLRLRGRVCLHASAVAVDGRAVALIGPSGAGKSTTAAELAKRGYAPLADDMAPVRSVGGRLLVDPAYPRLRLSTDAVRTLYGSGDAVRLTPTWDKLWLDLEPSGFGFQREPLSLAAVYRLDERGAEATAPLISALPAASRLITLISNTYLNAWLDRRMRAAEFDLLGRVAARVPLRRVTPHADPARLPDLCTAILNDLASLPAEGESDV